MNSAPQTRDGWYEAEDGRQHWRSGDRIVCGADVPRWVAATVDPQQAMCVDCLGWLVSRFPSQARAAEGQP